MNITLQNLSKSYGAQELFTDFSLEIASGTRLCLVGANGAGKTTLLRILSGETEPDAGRVIIPREARLGYVAQESAAQDLNRPLLDWVLEVLPSWDDFWAEWDEASKAKDEAAIAKLSARQAELELLYGHSPEQRAKTVLSGLGFDEDAWPQPLAELSGGWRERAKLARVLTAGADVLLLDEPTNHLDLEAVEWLESFLLDYPGVLVFVAHDRIFMDRVATHILYLGGTRPFFRKGGFSEFIAWHEAMEEQKEREAKRLAREIERKMEFVTRFKAKATKARQAASKRKQALKMEREMEGLTPEPKRKTLAFKWPEPARGDRTVCSAVDLAFHYDGAEPLWPPLSFNIFRGQKIGLVGPNGCGKSTLLKLLVGRQHPDRGYATLGSMTRVGYFSQHQAETLDPDRPVLAEIRRLSDPRTTEEELMSVLGLFLLQQNYFDRPVGSLSGGEKSRLLLATLFLARANFLVLDEPTNHLDLESREALIEALEAFDGTLLLVAHDRWLLSRAVPECWALSRDGLVVHEDGFAGYERARKREPAPAPEDSTPEADRPFLQPLDREAEKRRKREDAERRNALHRELKPRLKQQEALEARLEELSTEVANLEAQLADPAIYGDPARMAEVSKAYNRGQQESEEALEALTLLEEEIEHIRSSGASE